MSCYISSNNNRIYVALEEEFGQIGAITEQNRIPAVKLGARQAPVQTSRRDKTGSRTFVGLPNRIRKNTNFQLNTFMTQWPGSGQPSQGPLFQAAMGGTPAAYAGGTVASVTGQTQITFSAAHGLSLGQGLAFGGSMRFVAAVASPTSVVINAPFAEQPVSGSAITGTISYKLATDLWSASIFDYWDPDTVVHRIVSGSAMDTMKVKVNGDFHEFEFSGPSRDLIDSASFSSGLGGLTEFPAEPPQIAFDYAIVPGHLGQVWMGAAPVQFLTLTDAELMLDNNIDLRTREFGSDLAKCIAAGQRTVRLNFSVFEQDDAQTKELYQAARQRSPIGVMLQLGEQTGQLFGAYLPAIVPEVPEFNDSESRLQWKFSNSRAQGTVDDELYVAFG
jgi:hypothetical protein